MGIYTPFGGGVISVTSGDCNTKEPFRSSLHGPVAGGLQLEDKRFFAKEWGHPTQNYEKRLTWGSQQAAEEKEESTLSKNRDVHRMQVERLQELLIESKRE